MHAHPLHSSVTTPFLPAVSAYVTHGVFPNESFLKFKADSGGAWVGRLPACIAPQLLAVSAALPM